tara:strand:+ start:152 stop:517 length:366 start_codon:yes stop_codon:yes gene_type:complete
MKIKFFSRKDCINKGNNIIKLNIILLCILHLNLYSSWSLKKDSNINQIVEHCFSSMETDACEQALIRLEALQLDEASKSNYSCQTRLLGLQGHVIKIMHKFGEKGIDQKTFEELKEFCNDF